jgi:CheY-like chemotaxis protein
MEVIIAGTAREAVEITERTKPDLILMDIMMQGEQDGIDAAVLIRKTHQIPIIFLTGNPLFRTDARLKPLKPYWFFVKPVPDYYLFEAIHDALRLE